MLVSIEEAQARLPELALRVRNGGEVVITKNGQPYIKLVAHDGAPPASPRNLERLKGAFHISDAAIDELFLSPTPTAPAPAGALNPPPDSRGV